MLDVFPERSCRLPKRIGNAEHSGIQGARISSHSSDEIARNVLVEPGLDLVRHSTLHVVDLIAQLASRLCLLLLQLLLAIPEKPGKPQCNDADGTGNPANWIPEIRTPNPSGNGSDSGKSGSDC